MRVCALSCIVIFTTLNLFKEWMSIGIEQQSPGKGAVLISIATGLVLIACFWVLYQGAARQHRFIATTATIMYGLGVLSNIVLYNNTYTYTPTTTSAITVLLISCIVSSGALALYFSGERRTA